MEVVAELVNKSLKNAACLGDSKYDSVMMDMVNNSGGLSVAMGNALTCTKDRAKFITGNVDENSYKKAIDTIFNQQ